ncbi:hypothetical protein RclHR1_02740015 [Rhizophagus clarus]|uniref:Galactose oxidase n=1 Tax=Rhizophagus clarus TaxID=94130 RepID=A0A2Z6REH4_9GLOM|nr:hypothetical protein RclHR1_02740015 [Rhizophagus clarus]GES88812.1 hypothetical protein GLOIN_2v1875868 [Rhizophagus clarus]
MKFIFFLIISLYLLQIVNAQLSPSVRKLFSAVPIEKKLYIYGGFMDNEDPKVQSNPNDRFFYLDVSSSFDTSNLPWKVTPNNAEELPLGSFSSQASGGLAASIGGVNNDTIFFINNEVDNATKLISPVHSYNSPNNVWNTQNLSGDRPFGRNQMKVVTDYTGKIYLLTGFDFTFQGATRTNGLFVCDTIKLNCELRDASVFSRLGYGVTLLPNGNLVYMGGARNNIPDPNGFQIIFIYDTVNNSWNPQITTGNIPPPDVGITTVLGLRGDKIILFGGNNGDNNNIYVLNITNYEWYVPEVRGKGPVFKRGEHCANVIGKYMVITFGSNGVTQVKYRANGESDVLLLDISNDSEYIWTTSFDPTPLSIDFPSSSSPSSPPSNSNPKTKTGIIIGVTVGIIIFVGILLLGALFYIKRRKNHKNTKPIPTPGNINNEGVIMIPSGQELSQRIIR